MDYARHYAALIGRARTRNLVGYAEKHHVVPRCIGGTDDPANLVRLTPEEHFVVHQLLVKIHPGVRPLIFAVHAMMMDSRTKGRSKNKEFGWLRRLNAVAIAERRRGAKHTDETKAKMSRTRKGGKHSAEHRVAISAGNKGKPKSAEHVAAVSASLKGKPGTRRGHTNSPEHRARQSEAARRRVYTEEQKATIAARTRARSPEQRRAMALKAWATKRAKAEAAAN